MYEILIASVCGLIITMSCKCCINRNNELWNELKSNPHGQNRWKIVNKLHRETGISRKDILNKIKKQ